MDDLIERLRRLGKRREMEGIYTDQNICEEAADALAQCRDKRVAVELTAEARERDNMALRAEIERLKHSDSFYLDEVAENKRLRGALTEVEACCIGCGCRLIVRTALGDQLVDTNKVMGDGE